MTIHTHIVNNIKIAEVVAEEMVIHTPEDGLDLLGNVYYQGFDKMILHKENLTPHFFDLKNKIAGEILQKFSNYRVQLVIVGDFSELTSQSVKDFIFESNKGRQVNFISSVAEAIKKLSAD
jgi:hypothetical protein